MPDATINGTRLHYLDAGLRGPNAMAGLRGPNAMAGGGDQVVVLMHAFPFHSGMWEEQIADLAGEWRVIAPDLRGFGRSEVPDDPGAYSLDLFADDLAGLLNHLNLHQVVLGGLSMGGYTSFSFLRRHRPLVRALVLADTRAGADTPEVRDRRTSQQERVAKEGVGFLVDAMTAALLSDYTRQHRPEVVQRVRDMMTGVHPTAVIGALGAMKQRPDSTPELPGIDVPTLVIVGEDDKTAPPAVAEDMASRIPEARLVKIPDAGHLSNVEDPMAFTAALRDFLRMI